MKYSHNAELASTYYNLLVVRRNLDCEEWERDGDVMHRRAFLATLFSKSPMASPFAEPEPETPSETAEHKLWLASIEKEVKEQLGCSLVVEGHDPYDLFVVETKPFVERNPEFKQPTPQMQQQAVLGSLLGTLANLKEGIGMEKDGAFSENVLARLERDAKYLQELVPFVKDNWLEDEKKKTKAEPLTHPAVS